MAIPLLIAAGVVAVGSAVINAISSANAAAAQKEAAEKAMSQQEKMFNQQRADQAPWLDAGRTTLSQLMAKMNSGGFEVDPSQLANDPGFQFRMAEGQKALERSAAARGGLNSGGFMKGLARYSQGVASDEYQNAWSRNTDRFNRLAAIAGVGQQTAQNLGALGSQHANSMSELYGAQGNANAAAAVGQGNAINGGLQAGANMFGMYYGYGGGAPATQPIPTQGTGPGPWASGYGAPPGYGPWSSGYGYGG